MADGLTNARTERPEIRFSLPTPLQANQIALCCTPSTHQYIISCLGWNGCVQRVGRGVKEGKNSCGRQRRRSDNP